MANFQQQVQSQRQGLSTFLLQQKLQILHLLHLPSLELEEYLKLQAMENPALQAGQSNTSDEFDDEMANEITEDDAALTLSDVEERFDDDDDLYDNRTTVNNGKGADPTYSYLSNGAQSFQEYLKEQMREREIPSNIKFIVEFLIDSLDDNGYLTLTIDDVIDHYGLGFGRHLDYPQVMKAMQTLQEFDPPGVGAQSLQECLMIQLRRNPNHDTAHLTAAKILDHCFEDLGHRRFDRIKKALGIDADQLKEAIGVISHLLPKPIVAVSGTIPSAQAIIPEFIITIENEKLDVSLSSNPSNTISISDDFLKMMNEGKLAKRRTEFNYFRKKLDEAKWLVDALQQREQTMLTVMKVIAGLQRDFFLSGDRFQLKPMILEDVAKITGFHISTVSRITCNKYALTPFGNVHLKDLFSTSLKTSDGLDISTESIKQTMLDIINDEDKTSPLTDRELMKELGKRGLKVARRTVVKYREVLHLPAARLRKVVV